MLSNTNQKKARNKYKGKTPSHVRHGTRGPTEYNDLNKIMNGDNKKPRKDTFVLGQQGKEPQYLLTENCGETSFNAVEMGAAGANRIEP